MLVRAGRAGPDQGHPVSECRCGEYGHTLACQALSLLARLHEHDQCLDCCGGLSDVHGDMYDFLQEVAKCEQVQ